MIIKPVFLLVMFIFGICACLKPAISLIRPLSVSQMSSIEHAGDSTKKLMAARWIHISSDVVISEYFEYMDSLVNAYDSLVPYPLSEHLLAHANPWIIDTLANTDYYRMMARDSFVYDQRKMVVLKSSDSLMIPDSLSANHIKDSFKKTHLDVNIPEFKLRIYQDTALLFTFPVRVGKNTKKYLAMADKITDLRTLTGNGEIVRLERNPKFYNPVNQKRFYLTPKLALVCFLIL